MKIQSLSSRIVPWIWTYRFWRRLSDRTGLPVTNLQNNFSPLDIEALVKDFDGDPEGAADAQLAKWSEAPLLFDEGMFGTA